jgi:tripartite-type tricarboxylate transporter receptor subunit TctC
MRHRKKIAFMILLAVSLFIVLETGHLKNAHALDKSYFKGKKIKFLVPFKPGGGFDTYARLLSPYIKKYLPVRNVIVKNEIAGGGLAAMNHLARSKPDGTTIMILQTGAAIINELAEVKGVRFQSSKFNWLARVTFSPNIIVSNPKSSIKTMADMQSFKKKVVISSTGRDFSTMTSILILKAFDIPYRTVMGYSGSGEQIMAVIRGDADVCTLSMSTVKPSIDAGELHGVMVLTLGKMDINIPQFSKEADRLNISDKNRAMLESIAGILHIYRAIATSPGLSPELTKIMRTALKEAFNDPGFLASAKKSNRPVNYLSGEETQRLVEESVNNLRNDADFLKLIKNIFGGSY